MGELRKANLHDEEDSFPDLEFGHVDILDDKTTTAMQKRFQGSVDFHRATTGSTIKDLLKFVRSEVVSKNYSEQVAFEILHTR